MELTCYLLEGHAIDIRPARVRRPWMDETPMSYAYKCLPLAIANSHGWEMRCPAGFETEWNGGREVEDLRVFPDGGADPGTFWAQSHFGEGILTFVPQVVIRTAAGVNLWVTGPTNEPKDAVQPLSAAIEADWMPYTFTMNWKLTRPGERIRFERGEPFCFLFPIERGVVEACDPVLEPLAAVPELEEMYVCALGNRTDLRALRSQQSEVDEIKAYKKSKVLDWYMRGLVPDGSRRAPEHQTKVRPKPFQRPHQEPEG